MKGAAPALPFPRSNRGVALVVVLSFMALLVGVVLAFFSISQLQRQVSKSSSSQTSSEILADGAVNRIVGDLKSEIVAGSKTLSPSAGTASRYLPSTAANAIPALAVPGYTSATIVGSGLENVVKVSKANVAFYSGGNARAIAASTTNAALNGHAVSLSSWNKPLLMTKATSGSSTDLTPKNFTAPDWVLVDRSGSNPTAWNANLIRSSSAADNTAVVGRYAYVVYNEGGILDANVAGYPSVVASQPASTYGINNQADLKSSLAYADLTQTGLNQKQVDQLAAWRNSGTLLSSGGSPGSYSLTASSAVYTNFFIWANRNGGGFLTTSPVGTAPAGTTDHLFVSRQQLINFATQVAKVGGNSPSATQNALRYLGTFSRGISQPSYIPPTSNPTVSTPASTISLASGAGGNTGYGLDKTINPIFPQMAASGAFTRNDGSLAAVGDPLVRKRFALDRIAWITYAGPIADDNGNLNPASDSGIASLITALETTYGFSPTFLKQGGPTNIKKYFGLEWKVDNVTSADVGQHKWFYDYHDTNGASTSGSKAGIQTLSAIAALGAQAHEPDFFELLKASVNAGSKAKVAVNLANAKNRFTASYAYDSYYNQTLMDECLDYAVIQIGANIIGQATLDAYPPRIVFDNTGDTSLSAAIFPGVVPTSGTSMVRGPVEFHGVKNLPYLYRVHYGLLKLRTESPLGPTISAAISTATAPNDPLSSDYPVKDTGVIAFMLLPDVWNPHDVNCSPGYPAPASFRVTADSTTPAAINDTDHSKYVGLAVSGFATAALSPVNPKTFTFSTAQLNTAQFTQGAQDTGNPLKRVLTANTGVAGGYFILSPNASASEVTASNITLAFTMPQPASLSAAASTMFREPTILGRTSISGSQLKMSISADADLLNLINAEGAAAYDSAAGGFIGETPDALNMDTSHAATPGVRYTGFVVGLYPVIFTAKNSNTSATDRDYLSTTVVASSSVTGAKPVTLRLQVANPNATNGNGDPSASWMTYDAKLVQAAPDALTRTFTPQGTGVAASDSNSTGGSGTQGTLLAPFTKVLAGSPVCYGSENSWTTFVDPRTSRFSAVQSNVGGAMSSGPGNSSATDWIDAGNGILMTDRPGTNAGYGIYSSSSGGTDFLSYAVNIGWYNRGSSTTVGKVFRPGLFSQNLPTVVDDGQNFSTAAAYNAGGAAYYKDPDGMVRRAMGGYVTTTTTVGLPLASTRSSTAAGVNVSAPGTTAAQSQSRPIILNRPFASVAELGYVFSGTPWKNLDFFTPESGDVALLDVFSVHDTPDPNGLVAGTVDLNTRQAPVLQALFSGAYIDDNNHVAATPTTVFPAISDATLVKALANAVISRSTSSLSNQGPFQNVSELVGKYVPSYAGGFNGQPYDGFSGDLGSIPSFAASPSLTNIQRFRESAIRPLAAVGQTRVWNLMIDVVAQTGRYPTTAKSANDFIMEGERRYWVHLAVDRLTGKVLDKQVEVVQQ